MLEVKETANQKKNRLLGMPYGTATSKLRKILMFDMAKRLDEDTCYRCGTKIETIEEFSIEHTIPWQGTENPKNVFFDITKIKYSHLSCNVKDSNKRRRVYASDKERARASWKREYADPDRYKSHLQYKKNWYHENK